MFPRPRRCDDLRMSIPRRSSFAAFAVMVAAVLALSACGGGSSGDGGGESEPAGGSSAVKTSAPSGGGGGGGGGFNGGTAHVEVAGGPTADLPLDSGLTTWFEAGMHLVWSDGEQHLAITGTSQTGSRETGAGGADAGALGLELTVSNGDGGLDLYDSVAGECTVDVTKSSASGVEGTFDCTDVKSTISGKPADISGSFSTS